MGRLKVFLKLQVARKIMAEVDKTKWQVNMAIGAAQVTASIQATLKAKGMWEGPSVARGYTIRSRWDAFRYLLPKVLRKGPVRMAPVMVPTEIHYIHGGHDEVGIKLSPTGR